VDAVAVASGCDQGRGVPACLPADCDLGCKEALHVRPRRAALRPLALAVQLYLPRHVRTLGTLPARVQWRHGMTWPAVFGSETSPVCVSMLSCQISSRRACHWGVRASTAALSGQPCAGAAPYLADPATCCCLCPHGRMPRDACRCARRLTHMQSPCTCKVRQPSDVQL
jgi:hypothetical protein